MGFCGLQNPNGSLGDDSIYNMNFLDILCVKV